MARRILIVCLDAFGPDYLALSPTPNLDRMIGQGGLVIGRGVVPSVTNVNNTSIITGTTPSDHGITANYWLDRAAGVERFMESPRDIRVPTFLERARARGRSTALLTAKRKLLDLLRAGADNALSAEVPDADLVASLGPPPDIYTTEVNVWLLRALRRVLRTRDPEVVYAATTDYAMHKFGPQEEESQAHIQGLDRVLGQIVDDCPDREIYLTADHGMSAKSRGVDLERILAAQGIAGRAVPIIKDRYVVHHQNLGGAAYVHLDLPDTVSPAGQILAQTPGVEAVFPRWEAAREFDLLAERIGDLFVLADRATVFGQFPQAETALSRLRSHGSRHEARVPIIAYGARAGTAFERNFDPAAGLDLD